MYNLETGTVSVSRDVVFNESVFPFADNVPISASPQSPLVLENSDTVEINQNTFIESPQSPTVVAAPSDDTITKSSIADPTETEPTGNKNVNSSPVIDEDEPAVSTEPSSSPPDNAELSSLPPDAEPALSPEKLGFGFRKK